uniref:exonuclease domain-containing protein n=1 Tax=Lactococcus sp. TaxID=44273 RepID=UPI003D6A636F
MLVKQALDEFAEFCKGSVLVAHNAQFDIPFIRHHAELNLCEERFITTRLLIQ